VSGGFFVRYGTAIKGPHKFCGRPTLARAVCPNCRKPLLQFLEFDARDPRLGLARWKAPLLPLLFCWRCELAQSPFIYRVSGKSIEVLRCGEGRPPFDSTFPYPAYPDSFPGSPAELEPVPREFADLVATLNRGGDRPYDHPLFRVADRPVHQVGGEPRLVQGHPPRRIYCPRCRKKLSLFATVADDCLSPKGFVGNAFVQVVYSICQGCRVVGAYQQCD
jgi:hypothetical protein